MRYRLTCLTPLLVGDGRKLSPATSTEPSATMFTCFLSSPDRTGLSMRPPRATRL